MHGEKGTAPVEWVRSNTNQQHRGKKSPLSRPFCRGLSTQTFENASRTARYKSSLRAKKGPAQPTGQGKKLKGPGGLLTPVNEGGYC